MNLFKILIAVLCFYNTSAQTNETEIKQVQTYIQSTSQNEWFDPINETGTLANGNTFDRAYYVLPNNQVFSIIHTVFEKQTLQKVFYFKNDQLIACIIEETDANNANKLLRYADYFFKDGVLINITDENKDFPSTETYQQGIDLLQMYYKEHP